MKIKAQDANGFKEIDAPTTEGDPAEYAKLTTDAERIAFIAKRLNLQ